MTITIIGLLFPLQFFILSASTIVLYFVATICITEWRAKAFKAQAMADTAYIQKATDSLLNFETVKYFNAEDHELERFTVSLTEYKRLSISV